MPVSHDLLPAFSAFLQKIPRRLRSRILVACSGGPDSIALLDLAARWKIQTGNMVAAGHADHGLRTGSRGDALFVRNSARRLKIPFYAEKIPVKSWAATHKKGIEESSRILRYQALSRMAKKGRFPVVAVGHNLSDQAETVFMNIFRGTGPAGLGGMAPLSNWPVPGGEGVKLARPLLEISRKSILLYLKERGLRYHTDSTNRSGRFLRNRLRPILKSWERERPGFYERVSRLAEIMRDEEDYWRDRLRRGKRLFRRCGAGVILDLKGFMRYHRAEQRRLLRAGFPLSDFKALENVRRWAALPASRDFRGNIPGGGVEKKAGRLIFRPYRGFPTDPISPPPILQELSVPGIVRFKAEGRRWRITAERVNSLPSNWKSSPNRVFLDAEKAGALHVRFRRPGDIIRPLGMTGRKKVRDFFTDLKIPRRSRDFVPLVVGEKGIVWAAGRGISEDAKITPSSRRWVRLELHREK